MEGERGALVLHSLSLAQVQAAQPGTSAAPDAERPLPHSQGLPHGIVRLHDHPGKEASIWSVAASSAVMTGCLRGQLSRVILTKDCE